MRRRFHKPCIALHCSYNAQKLSLIASKLRLTRICSRTSPHCTRHGRSSIPLLPMRLSTLRQSTTQSLTRMVPEAEALQSETIYVPWWRRYTRWRPTSISEGAAAERALLASCSTSLEIRDVPVGTSKHETMHTIVAGKNGDPAIVFLPGYGAGAGYFFRNVDGLAKQFKVYLVDLLGTGLSGRPHWKAKSREEAEDFFLDALKKWQKELGIKKMILVGHSLGGYLAATYALKYPDDIQHLVLVCPAGMSTPPPVQEMPVWARGFTLRGGMYRVGLFAWDWGFTPGSWIRGIGPYGPGLASGYARNRFREGVGLSSQEVTAFGSYIYHTLAQRGSGEYALRHLLAPFAHARLPLEGRLHDLKVPCSLIYGQSDWMKPDNGKRVFADMEQRRGKLDAADLQFDVIPDAGHYPFLDQPEIFLSRMLKQTKMYLMGRGQTSDRSIQQTAIDADKEAQRIIQDNQDRKDSKRNFDL